MKSTFKFFSLFILSFLLVTCKKENLCDCFKGTGKQTTEERSVAAFNKVFVDDEIDVHITEGA